MDKQRGMHVHVVREVGACSWRTWSINMVKARLPYVCSILFLNRVFDVKRTA